MTQQINLWHSDLWQLSFSNIPGVDSPEELYLFERFAKSLNFPEYGIDMDDTDAFMGYKRPQVIAHDINRTLTLLQIEFKIAENFQNYIYLFHWLQRLKYGQEVVGNARDFVCKEISLFILDNVKRKTGRFKFTNCNLVNLTAIPMSYGSGEEVTFQGNFAYQEILWVPEDIPTCET